MVHVKTKIDSTVILEQLKTDSTVILEQLLAQTAYRSDM